MKITIKGLMVAMLLAMVLIVTTSCATPIDTNRADQTATIEVAATLAERQPTPTDISASLERYNLTRRAYWVNGMRERAKTLPCPIADVPLGYVVLFANSGSVVGRFEVDGKVTSLNSFLTPDSEYYEFSRGDYTAVNLWLADVDGSYGQNDDGIFFFTPDGRYIEWNGGYLYTDILFEIADPVLTYEGGDD